METELVKLESLVSTRVTPLADDLRRVVAQTMFVSDLVLKCRIGVHPHEQGQSQRVRINLQLEIADPAPPRADHIDHVLSYEDIVNGVKAITSAGHINLVETLADRIADLCLADHRVSAVTVRVEKLDVIAEATSAGVQILKKSAT